jgi:hypothetical protein
MIKKESLALVLFMVCINLNAVLANISSPLRGWDPNLGVGVRALGMGGAYTAIANDPSGPQWNPAGLCQVQTGKIDLMNSDLYGTNIQYGYLGGAFNLWKIGRTGFFIKRLDANTALNFPYSEYTVAISKAAQFRSRIGQIQVGINMKYMPLNIESDRYSVKAYGLGIDAGILIRKGKLRFASVIKDPYTLMKGSKYYYGVDDGKVDERLEPLIIVGMAIVPNLNWRLAVDAEKKDSSIVWRMGLEHWINNSIAWRIGLNDNNITAGFGIGLGRYELNYGYQQGEFGNTHRMGLSLQL